MLHRHTHRYIHIHTSPYTLCVQACTGRQSKQRKSVYECCTHTHTHIGIYTYTHLLIHCVFRPAQVGRASSESPYMNAAHTHTHRYIHIHTSPYTLCVQACTGWQSNQRKSVYECCKAGGTRHIRDSR
jgi:hypothetical protein